MLPMWNDYSESLTIHSKSGDDEGLIARALDHSLKCCHNNQSDKGDILHLSFLTSECESMALARRGSWSSTTNLIREISFTVEHKSLKWMMCRPLTIMKSPDATAINNLSESPRQKLPQEHWNTARYTLQLIRRNLIRKSFEASLNGPGRDIYNRERKCLINSTGSQFSALICICAGCDMNR